MAELYTCCVKSCKVYNKIPYQKRHFIRFPFENKPLLKNWIKALTNHCRYILPDVHTVICNNHFKRRDYAIDDGYMKIYVRAIPSVYGYKGNTKRELAVHENNSLLDSFISNILIYNVRGNFQCESQLQPQKDMGFIVDDSTASIDVDLDSTAIENQSNICTKNTMKLMKTNTPKPNAIIDVDLDKTVNENLSNICTKNTMKLMKTDTPKPNASPKSPNVWISKHNKNNYKYNIPYKFLQKLKILTRKNERLISKNRCLMTRIQSMKDIHIKYLELKTKVLETEEKLLINGIDTSEYSAFQISYDEPEPQQNDQMDEDILFECSLDRINSIPINNSNPDVSSEFSPNIEIIISSDEDIEIID